MASSNCVVHTGDQSIKIVRWKIKPGSRLSHGTGLLLYEPVNTSPSSCQEPSLPLKLKSSQDGTVEVLVAEEGSVVKPGDVLLQLKQCTHPVVMKDLCAECGADLRQLGNEEHGRTGEAASVSMIHNVPELRVSHEQAQQLGKADERRLLSCRKLVLLVDLDQTLIHTTSDNVPPDMKGVHHFQLYGPQSPWYHTRIRPGTQHFLEQVSQYYELHICTFGARPYAHTIASLLDPEGKYFSYRILSRDECFNPTSKTGNLRALFPCGDSMVCIIDDREDVWNYALNMVPVKPYVFFKNTGDINAPGGMQANNDSNGWPRTSMKLSFVEQNGTRKSPDGEDSNVLVSNTGLSSQMAKDKNVVANEDSSSKDFQRKEGLKRPGNYICQPQSSQVPSERGVSTTANIVLVEECNISPVKEDRVERGCGDEGSTESRLDRTLPLQKEMSDSKEDVCGLEGSAGAAVEGPEKHKGFKGCDIKGDIKEGSSKNKESEKGSPLGVTEEVDVHEKEVNSAQEADLGRRDVMGQDDVKKVDTQTENIGKSCSDEKQGLGEDVEDDDDYLLYLEEILRMIHRAYYDIFDQLQAQHSSEVPDLKHVIPYVRRKCLKGVHLVFSGVIPTNQEPEKSRIYQVARALGAKVSRDLEPGVTHLVAARPGTAKTNKVRRMGGIHLVNPGWLWCCAERWEHVAEQLFPLVRVESTQMVTPFLTPVERKGFSPNGSEEVQQALPVPASGGTGAPPVYDAITGKRIRPREAQENLATLDNNAGQGAVDGSLRERTNPHLSMSSDELKAMDQEVEDACSEEDDDESSEVSHSLAPRVSDDESSAESLTGGECPKGWKKRKRGTDRTLDRPAKGSEKYCADDLEAVYEDDEELPVQKFPRCTLPEDSDCSAGDGESSDDCAVSVGSVDEEMAAAVEREFLGL